MKKIPVDIKEEFGQLAHDIIKSVAKDSCYLISSIISDTAKYFNVSEKDLRDSLKSIDSDFTSNNNIIFYDGKRFVKRTTFVMRHFKIIRKIGRRIKLNCGDDVSSSVIFDTIQQEYSKGENGRRY